MGNTIFLAALDRMLKLLLKLVNTEMQTCTPRLEVLNTNYEASTHMCVQMCA